MRRGLVALMVTALVVAFAPTAGVAHAADAEWSSRVRPIARQVERLRRLRFEHPVPVTFIDRGSYPRRVAKLRKQEWDRVGGKALRTEEFLLRALGVMVLDETLPTLRQGDFRSERAEYDPVGRRILVKGWRLDVATNVALAGALTRALQDQHFGSHRLDHWLEDTDASVAYRALAEGDADRIRTEYTRTLGVRDQQEYRDTSDGSLPTRLSFPVFTVRGSPELFGPPMIRVLAMDGGRRAIDRALRHPAGRQVEMFDPTALGTHADRVRAPKLGDAEEAIGRPRPLGTLTLYTALALRLENEVAMRAADEVVASSARVYLDGSLVCVRARLRTRGPTSNRLVADTLRRWLGEASPGNGRVAEQADDIIRFDSCEGEDTAFESFGIDDLVVTPIVRNEFVVGQLSAGASRAVAKCVGDELLVDQEFNDAFEAAVGSGNDTGPEAMEAARRVAQRRAEIRRQCDAQ